VYKDGENLRRCLSAVTGAEPPPYEIIVVVDGDPETSEFLAKGSGVQVMSTPTRGGPARARNLGGRVAQGDLLFFVDADVVVYPDAVGQVMATFSDEPGLAAAFGSYDDAPAAPDFLSQYKNLFHHYVHQTAREESSTFWAACGAVRREVLLALGGFDERYRWPSIEDIEVGYRLMQAGHRIRLCKSLQVKHLKHWDIVSLLKSDFLHRALPWTELILRDRRLINDLNLRLSSRASVILVHALLDALLASWWWPASLAVAGVLSLLLLMLNAPLYHFFWRERGLRFALRAIPWHWLYYYYSGLAFAIGTTWSLLRTGGRFKSPFSVSADRWPNAKKAVDQP